MFDTVTVRCHVLTVYPCSNASPFAFNFNQYSSIMTKTKTHIIIHTKKTLKIIKLRNAKTGLLLWQKKFVFFKRVQHYL